MDYINDLHELCETISREIGEANEKIRKAGGKLTAGDVDYIDKLTHAMKSIKATIGMMENKEGGEYSGRAYPDGMGGSSYRGSYEGGSYARGRRNAPRDSMGRYSGESGYSRDSGMIDQLYNLMDQTQDINMRNNIERMIEMAQKSGK